jgi:hypothetical protein
MNNGGKRKKKEGEKKKKVAKEIKRNIFYKAENGTQIC